MCGILGYIGPRSFSAEAFGAALDVMKDRGPDDRGIYEEPEVLLGHRRLAILDLSKAGHQPMLSRDGRYVIVYNGEVYNYLELRRPLEEEGVPFRSNSDTEVILELYARKGPDCVREFRGMFAIAIWDTREKSLFLARDRMGIKPLYIWPQSKGIAFASEVKALRALPGGPSEVDPECIAAYLSWGSVPSPMGFFRGVRFLAPATCVRWRQGRMEERAYWKFPEAPPTAIRREEVVEQLRSLLKEAVALRCIADVPVGAFLSGGIDSSAVVALMRAGGQSDLRTFSISFPDTPLDESPYAKAVALRFGTDHHDRPVTAAEAAEALEGFLTAMDLPTCDGMNTYLVARFAKEGGAKVALSGLGGDELFAGYSSFRRARWAWTAAAIPSWLWRGAALPLRLASPWAAAKAGALGASGPPEARLYRALRGLFAPSEVLALLAPAIRKEALAAARAAGAPPLTRSPSFLHRVIADELRKYMHNQLLRDSDVFGMAHSLEIRVPLIDHKVAEALFCTPPGQILGKTQKGLLLDALPEPLPRECTHRPKMGFTFPFGDWMRESWRGRFEEALMSSANTSLDRAAVRQVWSDFIERRLHWSRPWGLFFLLQQLGATR